LALLLASTYVPTSTPTTNNPTPKSGRTPSPSNIATSQESKNFASDNRVAVGFGTGEVGLDASLLGQRYSASVIMLNQPLRFAVFETEKPDAFAKEALGEPTVRYVQRDVSFCALDSICGSPQTTTDQANTSSWPIYNGSTGKPLGVRPLVTPDFTLSASPASVSFPLGTSASSTITVTSLNGFSGTVDLRDDVNPQIANLFPPSRAFYSNDAVSVAPGGSATTTFTLTLGTNEPPGFHNVTIIGAYGTNNIIHSIWLNFTATDFGIATNPSSVAIVPGSAASVNLSFMSQFGFSGTVSLGGIVSPLVTGGPTLAFSQTSLSLSSGSSASSTLTVSTSTSTPAVGYTILVSGSSGSISHSICVAVNMSFPNDVCYGNQWGPSDMNLPAAWQKTVGSKNIIVALVDTGVTVTNPDLQPNLWTAPDGSHGWNCIANSNNVTDDFGHGTLTAGTVSAVINNGLGIAGTAQEQIMEIKAGDRNGNFFSSTVACGIQWATDHGANIISMSIGIQIDIESIHDAVTYAWNHGVLMVAAAGNFGRSSNTLICPACYSEVIAVSALQQDDTLASFSSYGPKVELSAPGANIFSLCWPRSYGISTCSGQSYAYVDGTSLSTPYVAAVAALVWDYGLQRGHQISNMMLRAALDQYAVHLGTPGRNPQYGFGKPDAAALLNNIDSIATADFSIDVSPSAYILPSGVPVTATISVTSLNDFVGTVTLSTTISPIVTNGAIVTLGSTILSLSANSIATTTITFSTQNMAYAYAFNITGTSGSISPTTFALSNEDYLLSVSPPSVSVVPGSDITVTLTGSSIDAFQGHISLNIVSGLPSCITYSFMQGKSYVDVNPGTSATTSLDFHADTSCGPMVSTLVIQGDGESNSVSSPPPFPQTDIFHNVPISLSIQDFSLSSLSPNDWAAGGSSGATDLTLQSLNGFSGSATMSATGLPPGVSVSFGPNPAIISSGGQSSTIMTVSVNIQVALGTYSFTVTASSSTDSHSIALNLKVIAASLNLTQNLTLPGVAAGASLLGTLTVNTGSSQSLTGTLTLSLSNSTTQANIYSNSIPMSLQFGDFDNGVVSIVMEAPSNPLWLSVNCRLNVTIANPACFISRTPDINHDALITIVDVNFVSSHYGAVPTSPNWDPRADLDANNVVNIVDLGEPTLYYGAIVFPPLVSSSASPTFLVVNRGSSGASTIYFASLSFSGTLTITTSTSPTGLSCSLSPASLVLASGSNLTSSLTCSTTSSLATANYAITITGSSGPMSDSVSIILRVQDFSFSSSVSNISITHGSAGIVTLSLASLNGFSGYVSVTSTVYPSGSHSPTTSINPTSIYLNSSGSGTSTLTIATQSSTAKGTYTVTVTALTGSVSHTVTITVSVT
jgi:hypothetical protein